jgi:hypothetical protein
MRALRRPVLEVSSRLRAAREEVSSRFSAPSRELRVEMLGELVNYEQYCEKPDFFGEVGFLNSLVTTSKYL